MAHQDIRRLTNELDAAKNNNLEPSGESQRFMERIAIFSRFATSRSNTLLVET